MAAQIAFHVRSETADIGDPSSIYRLLAALRELGVPRIDLTAFLGKVLIQQIEAMQMLTFFATQKVHALLIQKQAALDSPPAAFLHASPVLERIADKTLGRDVAYGLVPVLHLHRMQGNINDIAVYVELRHFHPVAHSDQVVGGDLHTGH